MLLAVATLPPFYLLNSAGSTVLLGLLSHCFSCFAIFFGTKMTPAQLSAPGRGKQGIEPPNRIERATPAVYEI